MTWEEKKNVDEHLRGSSVVKRHRSKMMVVPIGDGWGSLPLSPCGAFDVVARSQLALELDYLARSETQ
jgi:hypothetical protein